MTRNYQLIILFIIHFLSTNLTAQNQNKSLNRLDYGLQSSSFILNREYNSKTFEGYTLLGNWIKPYLSLNITNKLMVNGGFIYHHYFGDMENDFFQPLFFRAIYNPVHNLSIILGDINVLNNHNLPEYLYNRELLFTDPVQEGLSIQYFNSIMNLNSWIDWESFIRKGDPFREVFNAGVTVKLLLLNHDVSKIVFLSDVIFHHKGGEIDSTDLPAQTLFNSRIGLLYKLNLFNSNGLYELNVNYLSYSNNKKNSNEYPIKNGFAIDIQNKISIYDVSVTASYWYSNNYYAAKGDPYYYSQPLSGYSGENTIFRTSQAWKKKITSTTWFEFRNTIYIKLPFNKVDLLTQVAIIIDIK